MRFAATVANGFVLGEKNEPIFGGLWSCFRAKRLLFPRVCVSHEGSLRQAWGLGHNATPAGHTLSDGVGQ